MMTSQPRRLVWSSASHIRCQSRSGWVTSWPMSSRPKCVSGPPTVALHHARRDAEHLGQPGRPVVGVDAHAGERLDAALVRVDVRAVADDEHCRGG